VHRVPAHEAVVRVGGNGEAHVRNLRPQGVSFVSIESRRRSRAVIASRVSVSASTIVRASTVFARLLGAEPARSTPCSSRRRQKATRNAEYELGPPIRPRRGSGRRRNRRSSDLQRPATRPIDRNRWIEDALDDPPAVRAGRTSPQTERHRACVGDLRTRRSISVLPELRPCGRSTRKGFPGYCWFAREPRVADGDAAPISSRAERVGGCRLADRNRGGSHSRDGGRDDDATV
jgi:hypothetical protein